MDLTGRTLGAYEILEKLGEGGMGAVYRATHRYLNRTVALKILPPELARDGDFAARFLREGQAVAALEHPHIVPIYEAGEVDSYHFLAMRYIKGRDLSKLISERGTLPPQESIALLEQAASALDAAHNAGIIHRDIKPSNLMIEGDRVYLTDFGIAKSESGDFKTRTGTIIGTPEFMAPEQIQGLTVDRRADVYALAVVAFQMLCGQVPYTAATPSMVIYRKLSEPVPDIRSVRGDISPSVAAVLQRGMAPRPEDRWPTAGELIKALRAATQSNDATYIVPPQPQQPHGQPQQPGYQTPQPQQPGYHTPQPQQPGYQQPGYHTPQPQQPGYQTPYPQQPGYQQQPGYHTPQPHPFHSPHQQQQKSKLPLFLAIGGGVVVLLVVLLVALGGDNNQVVVPPTSVVQNNNVDPTAEPVDEPTAEPVQGDFATYEAPVGDYSIDYPEGWDVSEEDPNVQFLEPNGEALIQVTYSDLGGTLDHEQLVEIAAESLASGFGEAYVEEGREPQADGSTRLDFRVEEDPQLSGSAWIEQRGTGLYMLLMMVETDRSADYQDIFDHALNSYSVPQ